MLLPVVMAGGIGSRLWPLSRELYPKQFLRLYGRLSMLQETVERLNGLMAREPVIICNEEHRFLVAEQLRQINKLSQNIILEPAGRNTAPAIALAAMHAVAEDDDPVMLVLAADHIITDIAAFHNAIDIAIPCAEENNLITFGVIPTEAETGYGYIQRGKLIGDAAELYKVKRFVEKPDRETAEQYLSSGDYYWNSGIFMFRAKKYLDELKNYRADIFDVCQQAMDAATVNDTFIIANKEAFHACPEESVDYAVMENTNEAVVVPLRAGWSDVGSWSALWNVSEKDSSSNVTSGDVYLHNTENCYINTDERLVAAVDVNNLVIVSTKDAVLVANKQQVQDVKEVVKFLKAEQRSEYRKHRESYRPWGRSDVVVKATRFNVNRMTVKPGGAFSQQMHHHRAEHWVVLVGTAKVTIDNKVFLLTENQSTFIPIGSVHSLENPGKIPLELLEIQSGSYLGDDDIIRIKDQYGRE